MNTKFDCEESEGGRQLGRLRHGWKDVIRI